MSKYNEEITFKIIIIGNAGVGKTSILNRYINNTFRLELIPTLGLDFSYKTVTLKNNKKVKLKLFDTAGQEKFRTFSKSYFRNADCILFVYSIDNEKSFENITDWIQFTNNHISKEDTLLYLIENKKDLERKVDQESINDFLNKNNKFKFKSTSPALKYDNSINDLFQEISEILYLKNNNTGSTNKIQNNFQLNQRRKNKENCFMCQSIMT